MKVLKIIGFTAVSVLLLAFAYANVRTLSPTERLERVHLASFELKGDLNETERKTLETKIKSESGVTACAISKEKNLATVIYHPKQISTETLAIKFATVGKMDATKIELPTTGGCPVHAASSSVSSFLAVLDLRH
jgi:23S rRNA pseudoU1915 N3-methylase RlmH